LYVPSHFLGSKEDALNIIREHPFAVLVTTVANDSLPPVTQLPLILDQSLPHERLLGHVARNNPHANALCQPSAVLALFSGPNAYISPTWYPSKSDGHGVVPTWNYVAVEITGKIQPISDEVEKRRCVNDLSKIFEGDEPSSWRLDDEPEDFVKNMLGGIVAFAIEIEKIEAKYKLSQNRSKLDQSGVIEGLQTSGRSDAASIMHEMVKRGLG